MTTLGWLAALAMVGAAEPKELRRAINQRELVALVGERAVVASKELIAELRSGSCLLDVA
jgi:hypothetical protein